jgi:hypothetical protein
MGEDEGRRTVEVSVERHCEGLVVVCSRVTVGCGARSAIPKLTWRFTRSCPSCRAVFGRVRYEL